MKEENPKISLAMRAITFLVLLKQILYKNQPNNHSDEWETTEEDWEEMEEVEYEMEEEIEQQNYEEDEFKSILNEAIAKQLPEELEGNLELAELIRHTFYESLDNKQAEKGTEPEHVSDV